jgi:hypothetical protein
MAVTLRWASRPQLSELRALRGGQSALRPRAHVPTWVKAGLRNGCRFALGKAHKMISSGRLVRICRTSSKRATSSPPWTSRGRPHRVHSLWSARDRDRREWRSACAMRVNCSAPGCCQGTPAHPKTAQRRECDALGRETCARAGTRGVDRFSKTAITRRCAVWGCFWGPWASYLADAQTRLPQRSHGSARQRASRLAVKVT